MTEACPPDDPSVRRRVQTPGDTWIPPAVLVATPSGLITYWSESAERLYGWTSEDVLGRSLPGLLDLTDFEHSVHQRGNQPNVARVQCKGGEVISVTRQTRVVHGEQGQVIGVISTSFPIENGARVEPAFEESDGLYRAVVESSPDGVAILDPQGVCVFANTGLATMLGIDAPRSLLGQPLLRHAAPSEDHQIANLDTQFAADTATPLHLQFLRNDGTVIPVQITMRVTRDQNGLPEWIIAMVRDISEQVAHERELEHLALHDPLTGIPNRSLFVDRLQHDLGRARRQGESLAVLLLDLDRFKDINDTYGHLYGDQVLCEVAQRLSSKLRQTDTVARLGGDEFAVTLSGLNQGDAVQTVTHLAADVEAPIELGDHRFQVGVSVGIAFFPHHGDTVEDLLNGADLAMYHAKRSHHDLAAPPPGQYTRSRDRTPPDLSGQAVKSNSAAARRLSPLAQLVGKVNRLVLRGPRSDRDTRWANEMVPVVKPAKLQRPLPARIIRRALEPGRGQH